MVVLYQDKVNHKRGVKMNAVLIAVIVMIVLSLCRLNVVLSLFIGALVGV